MINTIRNIAVIGDGGWGTTLAVYLVKNNHSVKLWGPFPEYIRQMTKNRYNPKFLPGIRLPRELMLIDNLAGAFEGSGLIVFAIPSQYAANVIKKIRGAKINLSGKTILNVTKGIDNSSLLRMSEIFNKELPKAGNFAVLSGPTIAMEIAKGIPSTAVIASKNINTAKKLQKIFNSTAFRIYTNTDVAGVELGGSIKNIIAIACGACDGLGFGSNTKSAIITRGLVEMTRLGKIFGAKAKTFSGLSGLGDLVTTCFSPQSRNRYVGEQLGKEKSIKKIISSMEMVAEGVETVKAVYKLAQKHNVSMPITKEIYSIIYKKKLPSQAVSDLMGREMKTE